MLYQLPNGKVIHLSIEEYLDITDEDIQYLISIDYGEYVRDPFTGSAVDKKTKEEILDFSFMLDEDDNEINNIIDDDIPFDDLIDMAEDLDI
jgi:hypothetical protein